MKMGIAVLRPIGGMGFGTMEMVVWFQYDGFPAPSRAVELWEKKGRAFSFHLVSKAI